MTVATYLQQILLLRRGSKRRTVWVNVLFLIAATALVHLQLGTMTERPRTGSTVVILLSEVVTNRVVSQAVVARIYLVTLAALLDAGLFAVQAQGLAPTLYRHGFSSVVVRAVDVHIVARNSYSYEKQKRSEIIHLVV